MTREEKLRAVLTNDAAQDGAFVYAVKSTGIYCRPSCTSRRPNEANVLFFGDAPQAEAAGFRPCKRCRPDLAAYSPAEDMAREMKAVIESGFLEKAAMFARLKTLGLSPKRAIEIFKARFHMTPGAYADNLRVQEARRRLRETNTPVLDIALALGFESVSAFYSLFGKTEAMTPAAYRKAARAVGQQSVSHGPAAVYDTAFGAVTIAADADAVTAVRFGRAVQGLREEQNALTDRTAAQLCEYFSGRRREFTVPLRPKGTPFQQTVWAALRDIPYGQVRSYGQVAKAIGRPTATRAVGMANRHNPIAILIPCHRVVGKNGALTGYAAGLLAKQRLLALEQPKTT